MGRQTESIITFTLAAGSKMTGARNMPAMSVVAIAAIIGVFGVPIYFTKRWYDYREKKLSARSNEHEMKLMRKDQKQLMGRVEELEAMVLDTDYELNTKLSKLELGDGNKEPQKQIEKTSTVKEP